LAVAKTRFLWGDERRWRQRLAIALPAGLAGPWLFFGFGFADLYLQNPTEFPFRLSQLAGPALALALGSGLALAGLLLATRGRVFDAAVSLVVGLSLAGWTQANFLNGSLGELNGVAIQWGQYRGLAAANTALWLGLGASLLALRAASRRWWQTVAWLAPSSVIVISGLGLVGTYAEAQTDAWAPPQADYPTWEGAFTASSTANQYIFVLDMMDQKFVQQIQAEQPDFFASRLDGFTQFDNNISNDTRTFPSAVHLLTGVPYRWDQPSAQYIAQAYQQGAFLWSLREAGYSTNIYATNKYSYANISDLEGLADNLRPTEVHTPTSAILKGFARLAGFRYAPHLLKPTFWTPTDPFAYSGPGVAGPEPFTNSNTEFYNRLKASGLTLDGPTARFSYFHLDGAHYPALINAQAEPVEADSVTLYEQAQGAFKIVFDYLDELRRLGRYQDATIVITADHGQWPNTADRPDLPGPRLTALFVKPAGAARTALAHSEAPTEMANVRATLLADAGLEDPDGYPTVFEIPAGASAPRDFYYIRGFTIDEAVVDLWQVTGDARDFANWQLVESFKPEYWDR
jgi:hypothetical protein